MLTWKKATLLQLALLCLALAVTASAEEKVEHDRSRLSIFLQPSVSFLNFEQREYFQNAVDTIYYSFREDAVTESESLSVAKQDFQKVNFCFPINAGLQFQIFRDNFISAGVGFIYDNESVVLTDRKNRAHNYSYTIQGVPLFLEYRLGIPKNLMTLSGESLFSVALRWYWVLPGTEIYTTWGHLDAKTPKQGAGFGVSVGYLVASWKNFNIYGDVGFNSISVESKKKFSDIVPDGPEKKAKWNIGGLQMQVRVTFGLWNTPEPIEDDDDDDDDDDDRPEKQVFIQDSSAVLNVQNDSLEQAVLGDSTKQAAAGSSIPINPTDSAAQVIPGDTAVDTAVQENSSKATDQANQAAPAATANTAAAPSSAAKSGDEKAKNAATAQDANGAEKK